MPNSNEALVVSSSMGLYCPQGGFYIDPWKSVDKAIITHAHSDHARPGSKSYLTASAGELVLRSRLGARAKIESVAYAQTVTISGVKVSFHSAGHVLGSSQVRLEYKGRVWVVSGDYKTRADKTCAPFESVKCDCFITESTFGLPIYRWSDSDKLAAEMNSWWNENKLNSRSSVIYAYSFGKAQRLLSMVDASIGPVFTHPIVHKMNKEYIASGINLPGATCIEETAAGTRFDSALIIAPPGAAEGEWLHRLYGNYAIGVASGWTRIKKNRSENLNDRSFAISDHADWDELLQVIRDSGAEQVIVTHGYVSPLVRYLKEIGINARSFKTPYSGEVNGLNSLSSSEFEDGSIEKESLKKQLLEKEREA